MSAIDINTSRDQVKIPQQVSEGLTPALFAITPLNPNYNPCGRDAVLVEETNPTIDQLREAGDVDNKETTKTRENNNVRLKFKLTTDAEDLLAWACNKPVFPVILATPDESRSFVWSRRLLGVETFIQYLGCKPLAITITDNNVDYLEVDLLMSCKSIVEDTSGPTIGAGSFATPSPQVPLTHLDGGLGKLTLAAVAQEMNGYSITVTTTQSRQDDSGSVQDLFNKPTQRVITGTLNLFKKETLSQANARAVTVVAGVITIDTGQIVFTFDDLLLKPSSEEMRGESSDATVENKSFEADGLVVA